jgi:DNA-binding transcriptional LysR family regulator
VTLEQLRVFVAVAERQHVTRAAAVLNLAQSAVSAAIAALEARHGAKLFDRVGRGVELTDAGALFLVEARAILARVEAAGLVLSELGNLKRGTLAVHASQTIASYWLPRHLVAFRHKYPGIDIRLTISNTAQGAAALYEGAVDLAFIEGMIEDPMLTTEQVARDQLVIVVGTEHAWSATDRLEPDRLIETDWVLREPGSGTRSTFEAALEGFGVSPGALRVALELPSNEAVRAAVEAGLGATAISASVAHPAWKRDCCVGCILICRNEISRWCGTWRAAAAGQRMRCCRWSLHPLPDHEHRSPLHQSNKTRNTLSFGKSCL